MFLGHKKATWYLAVIVGCSVISSSYATIITIFNHTRYPVYAAIYYVGVNWLGQSVGPATKESVQVRVEPQSTGTIDRPTLSVLYHRQVLFSISPIGLVQTIGPEEYKDTPHHGIGLGFDTVFHVAELNGSLICYDTLGWVAARPIIDVYERAMEAMVARLREQYSHHPYDTRSALVSSGRVLSNDEQRVMAVRRVIVHAALERLMRKSVPPTSVFGVGLGFSGGGMRAALSADALVEAFAEIGLLDIVSHIAGDSGSTWFIADWLLHGKPIQEYREDLYESLSGKAEISVHSVTGALWPKYLFNQGVGPTDLFGAYLACRFLRHVQQEQDRIHIKFSHCQDRLADGQWPLPLCTAVEADHEQQHWITFTPFDVSSEELNFSMPLWAFGRTCTAGATTDFSPELDLGFLLGVWGSAFSGNIQEALKVYAPHMNPILYSELEHFMQETGIGRVRPCALSVHNPLYHVQESPDYIRSEKKLTLMDSGYSSGVPLVPLVRPDRRLKLIFMLDVSEDIHQGAFELQKAERYIRSKGLPFPKIDYTTILKQPVNIFSDPESPETPMIVYIVPVKDQSCAAQEDPSFDPEKEFTTTYKTTHLTYTRDACQRLARFIRSLVIHNKELLYSVVQNRLANTQSAKT